MTSKHAFEHEFVCFSVDFLQLFLAMKASKSATVDVTRVWKMRDIITWHLLFLRLLTFF